jgi:hypothetical protein
MTNETLGEMYLKDALERFHSTKRLADGAVAQVSDEEFFRALDPEANSIALVMKHMAGNMRSRWTDFLTSDGEKPDRRRDAEFESEGEDRRAILDAWEAGWRLVFDAVGSLAPEDLTRTVTIRHEPYTVVGAINRQLEHYGYHTGQIVFLAKHFKSAAWRSLSIPRGQSQPFNAGMEEKHGKQ